MKPINSAANPRYQALRRLVESSQERRNSGLSVLDGVHLINACLDGNGRLREVAVSRAGMTRPDIKAALKRIGAAEPLLLNDALFGKLSSVVSPTGILAVTATPRPQRVPRDMDACVMLEDLQDPGNLGSILRTCAAAGIGHVLLSKGSVHAWSPRVLRAGMGAHFALSIYEGVDLPAAMRTFGGRWIATRLRAPQAAFDVDLTGRVGFLFGNEGAGLSAGLLQAAHDIVAIPMPGRAESLNVAAAAAVCLFERVRQQSVVSRQRSATPDTDAR